MTELPGWSLMFRLGNFIAVSTSISRKCVLFGYFVGKR